MFTYTKVAKSCVRGPRQTTCRIAPAAPEGALGLTQGEFARRLSISRPTLNRLESAGQNTTLRTLSQLCRALKCRAGDLSSPGD